MEGLKTLINCPEDLTGGGGEGGCSVTVIPTSYTFDFCNLPTNPILLSVTLLSSVLPTATSDVTWLRVSNYFPDDATHGHFYVTWDTPPSCMSRTGHITICNAVVPISQPFSVVYTPATIAANGNSQIVTTVLSGSGFVGTSFSLSVIGLSGRTPALSAFLSTLPNCVTSNLAVNTNGVNNFYQPSSAIVPAGWSCPVGETLIFRVTACDGTVFTINQAPKAQNYRFPGTGHGAIVAGPSPVNFGPFTSIISVPLFDPNYPAPSSAVWSVPFSGNAVPVTSWSITTAGGNSVTFAGSDPGPYYLTGAQLAELVTKMKQGTCISHSNWSATVTIAGLQGVGPSYVIPSPLGFAEVTTTP